MTREIRQEEIDIVSFLLQLRKDMTPIDAISDFVFDLDDGGMGSIKFLYNKEQLFGRELIRAEYFDMDGTEVIISLNIDSEDRLMELEFWKVDFSRLCNTRNQSN